VNMSTIKLVIERHDDGYVGYPLGFTRGAIVGQGDTFADALKATQSAIEAFIEHYGREKFLSHLEDESPAIDAYIAETTIAA
jgi:predicted RNase H-like HicB family nuclease